MKARIYRFAGDQQEVVGEHEFDTLPRIGESITFIGKAKTVTGRVENVLHAIYSPEPTEIAIYVRAARD